MNLDTWIDLLLKGEEAPLPMPKEELVLGGLPIDEAIKSHVAWRENWFQALREHNLTNYGCEQVRADNRCKVGQWIYGPGTQYHNYPEYELLRKKHTEFHQCAGEAVQLHEKGHFAEAIVITKRTLPELSSKVGHSFADLLEAVHNEPSKVDA